MTDVHDWTAQRAGGYADKTWEASGMRMRMRAVAKRVKRGNSITR